MAEQGRGYTPGVASFVGVGALADLVLGGVAPTAPPNNVAPVVDYAKSTTGHPRVLHMPGWPIAIGAEYISCEKSQV